MTEVMITIKPDGALLYLYDERLDLSDLGIVSITRASQVEPTEDGQWTADLSPRGGPVLGKFQKRSQALAAERAWLEANL